MRESATDSVMPPPPCLSCAIYISSGLAPVAARLAKVAALPGVAVVDTFTDVAYARSSVKLVGLAQPLLAAARAVSAEAVALVDLREAPHPALHPRQGALDMISFMPLSSRRADAIAEELATCDEMAWELGAGLGELGVPVLMYGDRAARSLRQTRRGTSFFDSTKSGSARDVACSVPFDFPPSARLEQRAGVSIVGSQTYVTNFNIAIGGASLDACLLAASALRSQLGVQCMALPYDEISHEIGCNLQATLQADRPSRSAVLDAVSGALPEGASVLRSYVVGFTPEEALQEAERVAARASRLN